MGRSRDHVEHDFADTDSLVVLSSCVKESLEDVKSPVHKLFTELLYEASHAGKTHLLQLQVRALDDLEDDLDEGVDHLSQDEELVVDDALPDLAGLGLHCVDLIGPEDEHR